MPVDKEALRATIREAFGESALAAEVEQNLLANEAAATNFIGGFLRNKDYTQKNQSLADERRQAEADRQRMQDEQKIIQQQMEQYRQQLDAAEQEKSKVMKALRDEEISKAEAWALLQNIKKTYQLSNDDIPDRTDIRRTAQDGVVHDTSRDLDDRFAAFEKKMMANITQQLIPEMGGMARLPSIFVNTWAEHEKLTGKMLSEKEHEDLLNEADRRHRAGRPISYRQMWEERYDVPALRQKAHDTNLEKELRAKWDAEETAKRSEEALAGIRPQPGGQMLRTSNIFEHKFRIHDELPAAAPKIRENASAAERQREGGAARATRRWLEDRANGIPIGAPKPPKDGKVA